MAQKHLTNRSQISEFIEAFNLDWQQEKIVRARCEDSFLFSKKQEAVSIYYGDRALKGFINTGRQKDYIITITFYFDLLKYQLVSVKC